MECARLQFHNLCDIRSLDIRKFWIIADYSCSSSDLKTALFQNYDFYVKASDLSHRLLC